MYICARFDDLLDEQWNIISPKSRLNPFYLLAQLCVSHIICLISLIQHFMVCNGLRGADQRSLRGREEGCSTIYA